jgi:hypothetical protein
MFVLICQNYFIKEENGDRRKWRQATFFSQPIHSSLPKLIVMAGNL